MKRIWFAVAFIVISFAACIFEQIYIDNVFDIIAVKLDSAQEYAEDKDTKNMKKEIDELTSYWEKCHVVLCSISEHNDIDELSTTIKSLNTKNGDEIKNALDETKARIDIYYENQKLSFANIL